MCQESTDITKHRVTMIHIGKMLKISVLKKAVTFYNLPTT